MAIHIVHDYGQQLRKALQSFTMTEVRFHDNSGHMNYARISQLDLRLDSESKDLLDSDKLSLLTKPTLVLYSQPYGKKDASKSGLTTEFQLLVNRKISTDDPLAGYLYLDLFTALCRIILRSPQEVHKFQAFGFVPIDETYNEHDYVTGEEIHPGFGDRIIGKSITIHFHIMGAVSYGAA